MHYTVAYASSAEDKKRIWITRLKGWKKADFFKVVL